MALSGRASRWDASLQLCWLVLQDRLGRALQRAQVFLGSPHGAQTSCVFIPGMQDAASDAVTTDVPSGRGHGVHSDSRLLPRVGQPARAGWCLPGLTGTGLKPGANLSLSLLIGPDLNVAAVSLKIL